MVHSTPLMVLEAFELVHVPKPSSFSTTLHVGFHIISSPAATGPAAATPATQAAAVATAATGAAAADTFSARSKKKKKKNQKKSIKKDKRQPQHTHDRCERRS